MKTFVFEIRLRGKMSFEAKDLSIAYHLYYEFMLEHLGWTTSFSDSQIIEVRKI